MEPPLRKLNFAKKQVTYLEYILKEGQRCLSETRKEIVLCLPIPMTSHQVGEFLGSAELCRIWILDFAEMAKSLCVTTKESPKNFMWIE